MIRKNIFELIAEKSGLSEETDRVLKLFTFEKMICTDPQNMYSKREYSLKAYCSMHFVKWRAKGHCISIDDFLSTIGFKELCKEAHENVCSFLTLLEAIYNLICLAKRIASEIGVKVRLNPEFAHFENIILEDLSLYNHMAVFDEKTEKAIVIEAQPQVTAVAEIVDDELAFSIFRYNHRSLKGDLESKKAILLALGSSLEPKRKLLKPINSSLEDNIFFLLNNLNLRHNNRSKGNAHYKEYVSKMRKERLEKWYDELFQMILLANLELENASRTPKVQELKKQIN